jgi:hypothetical protein
MIPAFILTLGTTLAVDEALEQRVAQVRVSLFTRNWSWLENAKQTNEVMEGIASWAAQAETLDSLRIRVQAFEDILAHLGNFQPITGMCRTTLAPAAKRFRFMPRQVRAWGRQPWVAADPVVWSWEEQPGVAYRVLRKKEFHSHDLEIVLISSETRNPPGLLPRYQR